MRGTSLFALAIGCSSATDGDPRGMGACAHGDQMPSDRAVAACLSAQRETFATLVSMAEQDSAPAARVFVLGTDLIGDCWRFDDGWGCGGLDVALQHVGMATARYRRYIELLTKVGAYRIERHDGRTAISLFRAGIVTSGASKDLVYSPHALPGTVVVDTDRDRPGHYTVNYADLRDGWYIEQTSN